MLHPALLMTANKPETAVQGCAFFSLGSQMYTVYTLTVYMNNIHVHVHVHVQDNKQNLQIMMHSLLFQRAVCHSDGPMLAPRTLCLHQLSETAAEHDVCL